MTESDFQTFEAVGALVVVLDVEGRIVYWNHCCSDVTGYSLEEIRGRKLWDTVLLPEDVESVRAIFGRLRMATLPTPFANYWVTRTGARRWIAWSHTLTKHSDGQIEYIIMTGIDSTERQQSEDARRVSDAERGAVAAENAQLLESARRATDDLREANQHMVSATIRAQELTEEAESAQERAEASERELLAVAEVREMFIGIVGHDLRNPLGAIRMAVEGQLLHGQLDELDRRAADIIIKSSERMGRLIVQLLDVTRARLGGGFPIDPKPTDLREVCRIVAEEFNPAIQLEVEGDVTGDWDPDRLAEALSNIAGNAVEHAAPGTAVVVKARPDGPEVVVEIINQGEPIPAEVLPFIFEPFRRVQTKKSAAGNLGLGLYIAKQIVLAKAGRLDAHSVDGTTKFVMRLPRRTVRERALPAG